MMNAKDQLEKFLNGKPQKEKKLKWRNGNVIVSYTRVSDTSQFDNTSLDTQKKDSEKYAERRGLVIKKYFGGIVESAKTDERKEFKRMLDFVKKDDSISAILVYSYERFSRSEYATQLARDLGRIGVKVLSVIQELDVTSPSGRLQQDIFFAFGSYDNEIRRNKSVRGMVENLQNGYWVGIVPFGYTNLRRKEKAKYHDYVINKDGEILKSAFKWKAEGKLNNLEIVDKMHKLGSSIKYKSFVRIISNPFYCGYLSNALLPGKLVKGHHQPIVTEEVFLKANQVVSLNPHKGISKNSKNDQIPLKSFLKLEGSNIPFTGYIQKGNYYYKTRGKQEPVNIRADYVESLFLAELEKLMVADQKVNQIKEEVKQLVYAKLTDKVIETTNLKRKLTELSFKLDSLEKRFIENEITKELFEKYQTIYRKEQEALKLEIGQAEFDSSNLEKAIDKGIEVMRKPAQLWRSSDYDDKQRLQYLIFPEGIRYNKEKREVRTPRINTLFSLISSLSMVSGEKEKGHFLRNDLNSCSVAGTGIEPVFAP